MHIHYWYKIQGGRKKITNASLALYVVVGGGSGGRIMYVSVVVKMKEKKTYIRAFETCLSYCHFLGAK